MINNNIIFKSSVGPHDTWNEILQAIMGSITLLVGHQNLHYDIIYDVVDGKSALNQGSSYPIALQSKATENCVAWGYNNICLCSPAGYRKSDMFNPSNAEAQGRKVFWKNI